MQKPIASETENGRVSVAPASSIDPTSPSSRERRILELLAGFYQTHGSGGRTGRQALFDLHPELAAELNEFFSDQDRLHDLAEPVAR